MSAQLRFGHSKSPFKNGKTCLTLSLPRWNYIKVKIKDTSDKLWQQIWVWCPSPPAQSTAYPQGTQGHNGPLYSPLLLIFSESIWNELKVGTPGGLKVILTSHQVYMELWYTVNYGNSPWVGHLGGNRRNGQGIPKPEIFLHNMSLRKLGTGDLVTGFRCALGGEWKETGNNTLDGLLAHLT